MKLRRDKFRIGPTRPTLALTRNEVVTIHFALIGAIRDHQNEIQRPTRVHGPAESAMCLVDLDPLAIKVAEWLAKNPR